MSSINLLSKDVQEIIAAGEVVERPSAIVKELIENSLDADAKSIIIKIFEGGKKSIEIIDDGKGIENDDIELAVHRFATSKINNASDLEKINTFGFRGEALSSIAAVSKFQIESRTNNSDIGKCIIIEGGKTISVKDFACSKGTRIIVNDLFYNTPARKKFLRSNQVELSYIQDIVTAFAISNPDCRFVLEHGKRRLQTLAATTKENRISEILGDELIKFKASKDFGTSYGWLSKNRSKRWKNGGFIFVNNRYVNDRIIKRAIIDACTGFFERDDVPTVALFLKIKPDQVDVNVHPTKREVRFSKTQDVFQLIVKSIRASLGEKRLEKFARVDDKSTWKNNNYSSAQNTSTKNSSSADTNYAFDVLRPHGGPKPIGQIAETYVVCESEDGGIVIIDQHAAHERLMYDKLLEQFESGNIIKQNLLFPETIELSPSQSEMISKNIELLQKVGFEIEEFGERSFAIRAVPSLIAGDEVKLPILLEKLSEELTDGSTGEIQKRIIQKVLATIACHRQIRAGKTLSTFEMERLAHDISQEKITHCPHGRPAIVTFDKNELDKWFKRK